SFRLPLLHIHLPKRRNTCEAPDPLDQTDKAMLDRVEQIRLHPSSIDLNVGMSLAYARPMAQVTVIICAAVVTMSRYRLEQPFECRRFDDRTRRVLFVPRIEVG